MRLSEEQIKEAILHPDADVRELALTYFTPVRSSDPSVTLQVIAALERYGWSAIDLDVFSKLAQTEATVAWCIEQIASFDYEASQITDEDRREALDEEDDLDELDEIYDADEEEYGEDEYDEDEDAYYDDEEDEFDPDDGTGGCLSALFGWLEIADPRLLQPHAETLQGLAQLTPRRKERLADRCQIQPQPTEKLWTEFFRVCDWLRASTGTDVEKEEGKIAVGWELVERLSFNPQQADPRLLPRFIAGDDLEPVGQWLEALAGAFRLEEAIPALLSIYRPGVLWDTESAADALVAIGGDAVVRELVCDIDEQEESERYNVAHLLGRIHTDLAVETCLALAAQEAASNIRALLLTAALDSFSAAALEPARQLILTSPKHPDLLTLRARLLTVSKLLGHSFPEFDDWLEDSKHDIEFSAKWFADQIMPDFEWRKPSAQPRQEPPRTIVRRQAPVGRNDPCPCGSGKKYKKCCFGKENEEQVYDEVDSHADDGAGPDLPAWQFPIGTVALYGPDDSTVTKIVAGVIKQKGAEAILERWVGIDIKDNPKVKRQLRSFFDRHKVKQIGAGSEIMGCPHEEGIDFPEGEDCPFCPFWAGKQGTARRDLDDS